MMRSTTRILCIVVTSVIAAACRPVPQVQVSDSPAAVIAPDTIGEPSTITGTVTIVGADPATFLSLRQNDGSAAVTLSGTGAQPLRSVDGAVVRVEGRRYDTNFVVERFVVLSVNGEPVHDGILVRSGDELALDLSSGGRVQLVNPGPELYALVGSRVWMSRSVPGRAYSFGEISAR